MANVIIGCKLPQGIQLRYGQHNDLVLKINGLNVTNIIGGYGITTLDADLWATVKETYKDAPYMSNGVIFEVSKPNQINGAAKANLDSQSGFEQANPEKLGVKENPPENE